jgi:RecA/RadA recombinase
MSNFKRIVTNYSHVVEPDYNKFLPTGSTMLNLLLSNNVHGGYPRRKMVNLIGDSFTGKTFLFWTLLAEVQKLKIPINCFFDEPELAFEMNAPKLFGKNILDNVIWEDNPKNKKMIIPGTKDVMKSSPTIEAFGRQVLKSVSSGESCIYGLDSFDSLFSEKEKEDEDAGYIAARRVRVLNERMRKSFPAIKKTNSLLIIISQVRTNMDAMFGSKKTRSGGKALKHWATHEIWLALRKPMIATVRGKKHIIGGEVIAKTTKNRITGTKGEISFPLNMYYGIDDTKSIIDWLIEEKFWTKSGSTIKSPFGDMSSDKLIKHVEENEKREEKLKQIVQEAWNCLQDEIADIKSERKPRY